MYGTFSIQGGFNYGENLNVIPPSESDGYVQIFGIWYDFT